jgi:hypothetical protein
MDHVREIMGNADASLQEILKSDQERLQSSMVRLEQAEAVVDVTRPQVIVADNRAGPQSRAVFGTDTSQPQFHLNVSNNDAGQGAVVSAGVHTLETLQALLGGAQRAEAAVVLEALQNPRQNASATDLQPQPHSFATTYKQGPGRISENLCQSYGCQAPDHGK